MSPRRCLFGGLAHPHIEIRGGVRHYGWSPGCAFPHSPAARSMHAPLGLGRTARASPRATHSSEPGPPSRTSRFSARGRLSGPGRRPSRCHVGANARSRGCGGLTVAYQNGLFQGARNPSTRRSCCGATSRPAYARLSAGRSAPPALREAPRPAQTHRGDVARRGVSPGAQFARPCDGGGGLTVVLAKRLRRARVVEDDPSGIESRNGIRASPCDEGDLRGSLRAGPASVHPPGRGAGLAFLTSEFDVLEL